MTLLSAGSCRISYLIESDQTYPARLTVGGRNVKSNYSRNLIWRVRSVGTDMDENEKLMKEVFCFVCVVAN